VAIHEALVDELLWKCSDPDGGRCDDLLPVFAIRFDTSTQSWSVHSLEDAWASRHNEQCCIVIADTGTGTNAFGWPLRNLLALLAVHADDDSGHGSSKEANIIAMRGPLARRVFSCRSRSQAVDLMGAYTDDEIGTVILSSSLIIPIYDTSRMNT
jgi:hypothetical protein